MRRLVFACAVLVVLVGCSRPPSPIEPSRATPRVPSAVATTTLTPPELPKIAQRHDATGAANFVLYWVKVSNYAARTGDTALLRKISAPECEGCNRYIDLYEKTYAAGGYFKGGAWHLKTPEVTQVGGRTQIFGEITSNAASYKSDHNAATKRGLPENSSIVFEASYERGRWFLTQLVLQSEWSE